MQQLTELKPEQAPEPEARAAFVLPLVQQLLRNLSPLLACVGLLAASNADLLARRLNEIAVLPYILELPALEPSEPSSILLAGACLLLLLSINAGIVPTLQREFGRFESSQDRVQI